MLRRKKAAGERTLEQDFLEAAAAMGWKVRSVGVEGATVEAGGVPSTISFQNLRPLWSHEAPEARAALVRNFVESMASIDNAKEPKTLEEARSQLVVRVGPPDVGVGDDAEKQCPKWMMVDGHLSAFLVIDSPKTVSYVLPHHLREWNASFEDLYAIGFENLRRRTDPSKAHAPFKDFPPLRVYEAHDSFDAARALLLGDLLRPWPAGGALFAVPDRDTLMFGAVNGPETVKLLDAMMKITHDLVKRGGRVISDQVYWFDGSVFHRIAISMEGGAIHVTPPDGLVRAMAGLPRA